MIPTSIMITLLIVISFLFITMPILFITSAIIGTYMLFSKKILSFTFSIKNDQLFKEKISENMNSESYVHGILLCIPLIIFFLFIVFFNYIRKMFIIIKHRYSKHYIHYNRRILSDLQKKIAYDDISKTGKTLLNYKFNDDDMKDLVKINDNLTPKYLELDEETKSIRKDDFETKELIQKEKEKIIIRLIKLIDKTVIKENEMKRKQIEKEIAFINK